MKWLEVLITTGADQADALAEAVRPYAAGGGVALEQLGDPADLDPAALLPDVYIKIFVSELGDTAEFRLQMIAIAAQFDASPPTFRSLAETDWTEAWKEHFRPFPVGERFWIEPSWERDSAPDEGRVVLVLDPGMAFGTGTHETTQLCLEAVEQLLRPGMAVLDVGTGSGILALGALKLGASRVDAFDNDPVAVEAARENSVRNGLGERLNLWTGTVDEALADGLYDLVLVNILAAVIIPLLEGGKLLRLARPEGSYIFSGIIKEQENLFRAALAAAGGEVMRVLEKGDWIAVVARVPAAGQ